MRWSRFLKIRLEKFVWQEYLRIFVGVLMVALALDLFLIPNKVVAGGVAGIATILYYLLHTPVGLTVLGLNLVLFLLGFRMIGDGFGVKSVFAVFCLSGLIDFFDYVIPLGAVTNDLLLAVIFGSLLGGLGMAMVFNQDASTGGTDILAKILNKYTALDMGRALLVFDFLIAGIAGVLLNSLNISLYSLLAVLINTLVIDEFIGAFNSKKSMLIISRYPEEILHRIVYELGRGATILHGMGAYERRDQKVILTVVNRRQMVKVRNIVRETDPRGFVIIGTVTEVLGEGFREIKV